MSIYKPAKSPYYSYDFVVEGRRFFGSTKAKTKKDALAFEAQARLQAKKDVAEERKTGNGPLTMDTAAGRFWNEVGQHHANAATTFTDLERLVTRLGRTTRLDAIGDAEVAALVAWRRSNTVRDRTKHRDGTEVPTISNATVNRSTTILLRSIFSRAKRTWRYSFPKEPNWRDHILKEPKERVRELDESEADALDGAVREDYAKWFEFARISGRRRVETLIKWSDVNIFAKRITTTGKGGALISTPITPEIAEILKACEGHHDEYVFTYLCKRPRGDQKKGQRYPITAEGAKTQWRRLVAKAGVEDFRFHDIRHDVATKLLRSTGNLKLVQRALNHSDIKTTTKYAHVLDDEVAAALENVSKSRKKSRTSKPKLA
ncbi:site-specific integrase [Shinella sp.]|uniref:tyrosine-type recombinase/integrase n=1 Tax=Shinella sp. TaxID=1870904 RepID=UPI0028A5A35C|nr:site-specific integrase [Shinella sp.]